jgi:hypothetical protein
MKTLIITALTALALTAVTADAAKSPSIKQVNKTAKKALSVANDANHTADANTVARDKKFAAQDEEIANANRTAQTANERVSSLPPSPKDNQVHEYANTTPVAADSMGLGSATCPADMSVWSGGFAWDTNQGIDVPQPTLVGTRIVGQEFVVEVNNVNGTVPFDLDVYAYCVPR